MTYQIVYASESTFPMQSDDLRQLLEHARRRNGERGISGALVYTDGTFLQILEGEHDALKALMARIAADVRHEHVAILREGDVATARFSGWKMAYVSATPEQVARWAGVGNATDAGEARTGHDDEVRRTARFAQDILALLGSGDGDEPAPDGCVDGRPDAA